MRKILTSRLATWLAVAVLALCALAPRLALVGKIPAGQPQWSVRADRFWNALEAGRFRDTYLAPHPGLTVMWIAGAVQRATGAESRREQMIAASRATAVIGGVLILLAAWLVRRLLVLDGIEGAGVAALAAGLLLAFDPLLILMNGLVGLDGAVSLAIFVGVLLIALHFRTRSKASLAAAATGCGLAVATKAPGLLLIPAPLLLQLAAGRSRWISWRRVVAVVLLLTVAAGVVTFLLLPAAWIDAPRIARKLVYAEGARDESLAQVLVQGKLQYFLGETGRHMGLLFYPAQILYRATPLVLIGALFGLLAPRYRSSRLVRETALCLLVVLAGLTLAEKKSWRYIAPVMPLLDLLGALGLWFLIRHITARWRKPVAVALLCVLIALQGAWVLRAAPFYELRLNPLLGGPTTAINYIPLGWGEGIEQVHAYLESEAQRMGRVVTWSGGYGKHVDKRAGLEFESRWVVWVGKNDRSASADCHVYYIADLQRGEFKETPTDRKWKHKGIHALSVIEQGVELARVRCREDGGFRPLGTADQTPGQKRAAELPSAIVLLTLDTTRADHLSIYGYPRETSPFLERLARQGVLFHQAITPMPTTDPAHLSMLTGLHPRTHGVLKNGVPLPNPAIPNLALWAGSLGYRTGAFVSRRHLVPQELSLDGFEIAEGPERPSRDGAEAVAGALRWISELDGERFFVWLHLFDPHYPYEPPEPYRSRFEPPGSSWSIQRNYRFPDPLPADLVEVLIARYDAEIAYTDALVERMLDGIRSLRPDDRPPLVIVVGDHGEAMDELWERYRLAFDHGKLLYQGLLRVPLIFWWPGHLPAGVEVAAAVSLVDLAPTLFELLGAPGFAHQGSSLLAGIETARGSAGSDPEGVRRPVFSERRHLARGLNKAWQPDREHFAIQDGRYKLIVVTARTKGRTELYDLWDDPDETRDLSAELPETRDRLLAELERWLATTAATEGNQEIPDEKIEALRALGYLD